jgi:hypothetical protein
MVDCGTILITTREIVLGNILPVCGFYGNCLIVSLGLMFQPISYEERIGLDADRRLRNFVVGADRELQFL